MKVFLFYTAFTSAADVRLNLPVLPLQFASGPAVLEELGEKKVREKTPLFMHFIIFITFIIKSFVPTPLPNY